jgi:hypothetical protein
VTAAQAIVPLLAIRRAAAGAASAAATAAADAARSLRAACDAGRPVWAAAALAAADAVARPGAGAPWGPRPAPRDMSGVTMGNIHKLTACARH